MNLRIVILLIPIVTGLISCHGLSNIPQNRWVKLHEQSPGDSVIFTRQTHGGSAYDSRRHRIVLFGSDTHGNNWYNSPFYFDIRKRRWYQLYPHDTVNSYGSDHLGVAVAGIAGKHPWAMHTYGAVSYHEETDELVVSSHPAHLEPGRFTSVLQQLWPTIKRHPTWYLRLTDEKWYYQTHGAVSFFPYATCYDSFAGRVLGYRSDGVYQLSAERGWQKVVSQSFLSYHNNCVFDEKNAALLVMGSRQKDNRVIAYFTRSGEHRVMPTKGKRPPRSSSIPMSYHKRLGKTVALFPAKDQNLSKTWLYDLSEDRWQELPGGLIHDLGMNYNLHYAAKFDLLLLITTVDNGATSVWALRL